MRSNSLELVRGWLAGKGKVQTRLVCDVRDVAALHLAAAHYDPDQQGGPIRRHQRRFIAGTEHRVSAERMRACLVQGAQRARLDPCRIRSLAFSMCVFFAAPKIMCAVYRNSATCYNLSALARHRRLALIILTALLQPSG